MQSLFKSSRMRIIFTDYSESIVECLEKKTQLAKLASQGRVDFAVFNAQRDSERALHGVSRLQ